MACQNKCGCKKQQLPKEEITADVFSLLPCFKQLISDLIKTGLSYPVKELTRIADAVSALVLENENLRALLGLQETSVTIVRKATDVDIRFGPGKRYTLTVPVVGPIAKKELADCLRGVAEKLDDTAAQQQLPLPFAD